MIVDERDDAIVGCRQVTFDRGLDDFTGERLVEAFQRFHRGALFQWGIISSIVPALPVFKQAFKRVGYYPI